MRDSDTPSSADSSDLDLVAATYRYVGDDSAFYECLAAWTRKLAAIPEGRHGAAEEDRLMGGPLRGLNALVERMAHPAARSPVEEAVSEVDAAAMVVTSRGTVVALNAAAHARFGAVQGQTNAMNWLDPTSEADFAAVIAGADDPDHGRHAIVRTVDDDDRPGLAEVYPVAGAWAASRFIAVRALETRWSDTIDTMLQQAFDLTEAEQDVCRCLYETRDVAAVATRRKTSVATTRTQVRTILAKTGATSQIDLIRLLGLLAARASHGRRSSQAAWRDPWGNETIVIRPDGRKLAYSWTGAADGVPALLVHGSVQGYILGADVEARLHREGIKLFAIVRPGFGASESSPTVDFAHDRVDAIDFLLKELGFGPIPAIGLGIGSEALLRLAARPGDRFTRLLILGLLSPFSATALERLAPVQRALIGLIRRAPRAAETFIRISERYIEQKGVDWFIAKGWGEVPEVQATLADPEILPLIRNACALSVSGSTWDFVRDVQSLWCRDPIPYGDIGCPVHHMHGEFDRSISGDEAAAFAARSNWFTTECVAGAGFFLLYEKPDLFADRLVETVRGVGWSMSRT